DVCFLNSKGFGGNNASAYVLAPHVVERMLRKRHGEAAFDAYLARREASRAAANAYDQQALRGQLDVLYRFGEDMIDEHALQIDDQRVQIPGFAQPVRYPTANPYRDMVE
ncbi:MAG TPA: beta-ketoacyl synthase, partial [Pseudomonas sp.]|nr:beta-ketoacyl synthase [Pseudomonas sp.]